MSTRNLFLVTILYLSYPDVFIHIAKCYNDTTSDPFLAWCWCDLCLLWRYKTRLARKMSRLWTLELPGHHCGLLRLTQAMGALMAQSFILVCIPSRSPRYVHYERNIGHFHGVVLIGLGY
jgi:hypothetical protein